MRGPARHRGRARRTARRSRGVYVGADAVTAARCRARAAACGIPVSTLAAGRRATRRRHASRRKPVFAVVRRAPTRTATRSPARPRRVVALASSDPGNAGTLMRSAAAAGRRRNRPRARIGRRVQSQGRARLGRRVLRGPDRGGRARRGDARRRSASAGVRRVGAVATAARRPRQSTCAVRPRSCSATKRTGSTPTLPLDELVTIPMHGGRVAERRDGRHRAAVRSGPPAAGRVDERTPTTRRARDERRDAARTPIAAAATSTSSTSVERTLPRARRSPLNEMREAIKNVDGADRAAVGKALARPRAAQLEALVERAATQLAAAARAASLVRRPARPHRRRPRVPARPPASGHAHLARARRRVRRPGLQGRRRSRGRARLVQLRGAQLPARASGARDAGHALREARRARSR